MCPLNTLDWQQKFKSASDSAWSDFLDQYNIYILQITSDMFLDPDHKMDAYSYVLEKMQSKDYYRITEYYHEPREYDFLVWLSVVVRNLCRDFIRRQKGRRRLPKYVKSLSNYDQLLYKYIYWKQYPREVTYDILCMNHGYSNSFKYMIDRLDNFSKNMDGHHIKHNTAYHSRDPLSKTIDILEIQTNQDKSSEKVLICQESQLVFDEIFKKLPYQDQLILKVHFLYGRTLKETAKLLKIKNIWQVHRRLKKAITYLSSELKKANISFEDLPGSNLK